MLTEAQTTPLAALVTKFGGGLPAGMLRADGVTDNAGGGPYNQVRSDQLAGRRVSGG